MTGDGPDNSEFGTIDGLLALAEQRLPEHIRDFIFSGSGAESTVRRNRSALEQLVIAQSMLTTEDDIDVSVDFLGTRLASPLVTAPIGMSGKLWPEGDIEMAQAAGRQGVLSTLTANSVSPFADVGAAAEHPLLFQFHIAGVPAVQHRLIDEVEASPNFFGICATVHSQVSTRLDRYIESRPPTDTGHFPEPRSPKDRFTWADVDRLRERVKRPFGLKGVMSAGDAEEAIARGVDFLWVSNHGGRTLDSARSTIDALGDVADTVQGRVPIIVDSGFQRGSDVLKAIARGADLVAFGKLAACALAVGGGDAVELLLRILRAELENALSFSGHTSLGAISTELLRHTGE